jgi:hypothetical protein
MAYRRIDGTIVDHPYVNNVTNPPQSGQAVAGNASPQVSQKSATDRFWEAFHDMGAKERLDALDNIIAAVKTIDEVMGTDRIEQAAGDLRNAKMEADLDKALNATIEEMKKEVRARDHSIKMWP